MTSTDDVNGVQFTGEVVEITSRAWDGKTYWTMIVAVRGSYYSRDEKREFTNYVAVDLDPKRAERRGELPPGTKIRVDGSLRGSRGKQGGCFMSVRISNMAITAHAPPPPKPAEPEPGALSADDEVPF